MLYMVAEMLLKFFQSIDSDIAHAHDPLLNYHLVIKKDELRIESMHHNLVLFSLLKRNDRFFCRATSFSHEPLGHEEVFEVLDAIRFLVDLKLPGWSIHKPSLGSDATPEPQDVLRKFFRKRRDEEDKR